MDRIGIFKIKESFNTSLGIIVSGHLVEGTPKIGASLQLIINNKSAVAKISGMTLANIDGEVGLRLSFENEHFRKFMETNKIQEQIVKFDFNP